MTRRYTPSALLLLSREGGGVCLACGAAQDCPDFLGHPPLCEECDRYEVIGAGEMLRVLALVEEEEG